MMKVLFKNNKLKLFILETGININLLPEMIIKLMVQAKLNSNI